MNALVAISASQLARWRAVRCTQNATAGEEWRRGWHRERYQRVKQVEHVLVVGGGPAGLESALVAARQGYQVTWRKVDQTWVAESSRNRPSRTIELAPSSRLSSGRCNKWQTFSCTRTVSYLLAMLLNWNRTISRWLRAPAGLHICIHRSKFRLVVYLEARFYPRRRVRWTGDWRASLVLTSTTIT